ncbi:PREDICTED: uncharacterized protein LOC104611428 [Nelumbo nucifera]|uniref:Fungal lipase-type domain-containing protein n=2 Tax=Nelumbo nucifera TaxID=4432 RepID=A0A822YZ80_NELNU|nr:PREDICTED: uncharacterized protein LOC104611428 [Nelumbo nucifera]DAD36535.1 TPA_asm: hypothetical protein HUJ06_007176 [Nelumbo nucifera]
MASFTPSKYPKYMIYHPEKIRISDILGALLFRRRLSVTSNFVEIGHQEETKPGISFFTFISLITLIVEKILLLLDRPLYYLGFIVEFTWNLFSLNGGIIGLIFRIIKASIIIPKRDSVNFRSIVGYIDGRKDLYYYKTSSDLSLLPEQALLDSAEAINPVLDLCVMAAKVVYENRAYVENVITNHWKMHFVGFYDFWDEYRKSKSTQASIFCDRAKDARLIVVAFRGTEPFNAKDWITDVDLSWLSMGNMGRVHRGFMKALGLQDDKDFQKGWPKDYDGDKELAYYIIREKLKTLLEYHKGARIIITGHSLGAALATIFPAILAYHKEDQIMDRLLGVYTFGQPRVGDEEFGRFMEGKLNKVVRRYFRVVHRFDIVPRVPFEDNISQFSHFGGCIYYKTWYNVKVLKEEPNKNYFDPKYHLPMYFYAWLDIFLALFVGIYEGRDFHESFTSILFRIVGLYIPGVSCHSPRDYVNDARLGKLNLVKKSEDAESLIV